MPPSCFIHFYSLKHHFNGFTQYWLQQSSVWPLLTPHKIIKSVIMFHGSSISYNYWNITYNVMILYLQLFFLRMWTFKLCGHLLLSYTIKPQCSGRHISQSLMIVPGREVMIDGIYHSQVDCQSLCPTVWYKSWNRTLWCSANQNMKSTLLGVYGPNNGIQLDICNSDDVF